jgi:hypothetical protein
MRSLSWRPRHGVKLSALDKPSKRTETSAKYVLGKIPRIFLYPVWGIVVAAFLTFTGRGELQFRTAGLLLVWLWLSVDLWAYLIRKDWGRWKFVVGWTTTHLMLIGAMGIMWWWMIGKLNDQQDDTYKNLSLVIHPALDPFRSVVSITNGGNVAIEKDHELLCDLRDAVYEGHQIVANFAILNKQRFLLN